MLDFQGDEEESEDDADYAPDAPGGSDAESSSDSGDGDDDEDSDDGARKKSKKRSGSGSAKKGASKKQVGYMCCALSFAVERTIAKSYPILHGGTAVRVRSCHVQAAVGFPRTLHSRLVSSAARERRPGMPVLTFSEVGMTCAVNRMTDHSELLRYLRVPLPPRSVARAEDLRSRRRRKGQRRIRMPRKVQCQLSCSSRRPSALR